LALTPGTRLGVYEVTALIGEGGMGQVYQARDTKLNRDPDATASRFASQSNRQEARFVIYPTIEVNGDSPEGSHA
jgi:serine/threonine protein kinase